MTPLPDTPFWRTHEGRFEGILTWQAFDDLWERLAVSDGAWYVFDLGTAPPDQPVTGAAFAKSLGLARDMYAPVQSRSYCGAVYVDDRDAPTFVKVFDPFNMGSACGCSGERILPSFVFSRIMPDPLPAPEPVAKPGFFTRMIRPKIS
ncbi:MAG: hypothetical protein GY947_19155 [Rhodobacteraceae bacterium]|nr:hypothetical protein [Paracoccaceae bacterium]